MRIGKKEKENSWVYRGKCRNCGFICDWFVRKGKPEDWVRFAKNTKEIFFCGYTDHCDGCHRYSVWDLLLISESPSLTGEEGNTNARQS